jgi:hypothetical protein
LGNKTLYVAACRKNDQNATTEHAIKMHCLKCEQCSLPPHPLMSVDEFLQLKKSCEALLERCRLTRAEVVGLISEVANA